MSFHNTSDRPISNDEDAQQVDQDVAETMGKLEYCPPMYWPNVEWCNSFTNRILKLVTWYIKEGKLDRGLIRADAAIRFIYFQRQHFEIRPISYTQLRQFKLKRCDILLRLRRYDECIRTCEIQIRNPEEYQKNDFRIYLARSLLSRERYDECIEELTHFDQKFYRENAAIQTIIHELKTQNIDTSKLKIFDDLDKDWILKDLENDKKRRTRRRNRRKDNVDKDDHVDPDWIPKDFKYNQPGTNSTKDVMKKTSGRSSRRAGKTRREQKPTSPPLPPTERKVALYADKSRHRSNVSVLSGNATTNVRDTIGRKVARSRQVPDSKSERYKSDVQVQQKKPTEKVKTGGKSQTTKSPPQRTRKDETTYCSYCNITLHTYIDVQLHVTSSHHRVNVRSDSNRNWCHRNPPLNIMDENYKMCERYSKRRVCERGEACVSAHSEAELKEWKQRYHYRMRKIHEAQNNKLSSFVDIILLDYNFNDDILKDNIPGVCIDGDQADVRQLDATKRINDRFNCSFKYTIRCTGDKMLESVALLHDEHRVNFNLTKPTEVDKPQMCPAGNLISDDYMTYDVSVQFLSSNTGRFNQWVIFNFGNGQYMKREMSVHVGLLEDAPAPITGDSIRPKISAYDVIPFEEIPEFQKQLQRNAKSFKPKTTDKRLLEKQLSESNYKRMMHRMIDIEEREQTKLIGGFNLKTKIVISDKILTDSMGASSLQIAQAGELFGKIDLQKTLDIDSLAGILILESVNYVACRFSSHPKVAFEGKIYNSKNDSCEDTVYVSFNAGCVTDISLKAGGEYEAEIEFRLDRIPFVEMHFAVNKLQEMRCVWPNRLSQLTVLHKGTTELDEHQETAARFICSEELREEEAPLVICGPFGTGKTRVLATSAKRILKRAKDCRLLICTMSNSAADLYITDGLKEESCRLIKDNSAYHILRIYQPNRNISTIREDVKKHCLWETKYKLRVPQREDIEKARVVICTLATAIYLVPLDVKGMFTHIMIDEAGQALEPQTIMPLTLADKNTRVVLAGDHLQMSPKIYSELSGKAGFHISLLERLKILTGQHNSVYLRRNYRTCRPILEFISDRIYKPGIECATVNETVHPNLPAMSFYEVKGLDTKLGSSYTNIDECAEIADRVQALYDCWPSAFGEKDIAVITPYHAQVFVIRKLLRKRGMNDVIVDNVRNIQGKQFRVIFISTVRTRKTLNLVEITAVKGNDFISTHKYGFLTDKKLLNTAFTRAKSMVTVVGDPVALCSVGECCLFWSEYVKRCEATDGIFPEGLTFDRIRTEIYSARHRLNPSAKSFEPSGLSSFFSNSVPDQEHVPSVISRQAQLDDDRYRRTIEEKRREERLHDVILRELELDADQQMLEVNVEEKESDVLEHRAQQRATNKTKKTTWKSLNNIVQFQEGINIRYIISHEDDRPQHSIDDWSYMCKSEPDTYKYCTFKIENSEMFAIDDNTGEHICIPTVRRRGTAFNKDRVIVKVLSISNEENDCNGKIYGEVKHIVARHTNPRLREFVCKLDPRTNNLMAPINNDFPKLAILGKVGKTTLQKAKFKIYKITDDHKEDEPLKSTKIEEVSIIDRPNALFLVVYLQWSPNHIYPLGCVTKRLPLGDTLQSGLKIISLEHNVDSNWTESVKKEVRENKKLKKAWQIPATEVRDRLDLRKEYVFTIDPIDANDLDDALNITELENGHYKVGIHIADVSYFVEKQSEIDLEAKKRCTSYYPTSSDPIHMIHKNLSTNACSLSPGEDRLTISIILKLDKDGNVMKNETAFRRCIIKSHKKLSYRDAEKIILKQSDESDKNLTKQIRLLNYLANKRRKIRLKSGRFCYNHNDTTDELDSPLAHSLVEEFMILANETVAEFLTKTYPKCVPLRRQLSPDSDKMKEWSDKFHEAIHNSLDMSAKITDLAGGPSGNMCLTKSTWNRLVFLTGQCVGGETRFNTEDFLQLVDLVANDMLHPQLLIMKLRYFDIQTKSEYVCSDHAEDKRHYSLSLSRYTHFTSPIRRYIDLVVHRLLVEALDKVKRPSYTPDDIKDICDDMNKKILNSKRFERRTNDLVLALDLKKSGALQYHPVIDRVDDSNIYLVFPQYYITRCQSRLGYKYLKPSERIITEDDTSTVNWNMTIYDAAAGSKPSLNPSIVHNRDMSHLDPARFVVEMDSKCWTQLVDAITTQADAAGSLRDCLQSIKSKAEMRTMHGRKLLVDTVEYEKFQRVFQPFDVMRVHLAPKLNNGVLQPTIQLVSLAENIDVCVEHREHPILCFSKPAIRILQGLRSTDEYRKAWIAVLDMCSAYDAVHEDNTIIIRNVNVSWKQNDDESFTGSFKLPKEFCESNNIWFFKQKKGVESNSRALDYVCVRYSDLKCPPRPPSSKPAHLKGMSTSVWVGHCYTTEVKSIDDESGKTMEVKLKLNQSAIPLPMSQIQSQGSTCAIELIPKSLPDRRGEDAVFGLSVTETPLANYIALQQEIIPNRDNEEEIQIQRKLNSICRSWRMENISFVGLPRPNRSQARAIEKAISQTFTVIQGPPGTGKSVTGTQLAYCFVKINKIFTLTSDTGIRPQVLYCGPSNKSVEVVAGYLKKLTGIKVVRVYSESIEDTDYPRPWLPKRKLKVTHASENHDIALHHLIRQSGNKYSKEIFLMEENLRKHVEDNRKYLSRKFRDGASTKTQQTLKPTASDMDEYVKLISKAKKEELQKYDVILTTCNIAGSYGIRKHCEIFECIIDEAGMCTEPESLVPLVGCTPYKVVLIGDHKQLRPIVMEPNASDLGMEISLLERYAEEAIMLETQYRMHLSICEFPSEQFYNNRLTTDVSVNKRTPDGLNWPRDERYEYHTLFCHVEGKEESQTVKTDEGNENSRCNKDEIGCLIKVVLRLLHKGILGRNILVLTQYRLQLKEIKDRLCKDRLTQDVQVATVITSQGSESDYVIMSTVRSIPKMNIEERPTIGWKKKYLGFIIDENQTNVALTRAKRGLILIGNKDLLKTHNTWRKLIESYEAKGCLMYGTGFLTRF